jgi:hypothetical protein
MQDGLCQLGIRQIVTYQGTARGTIPFRHCTKNPRHPGPLSLLAPSNGPHPPTTSFAGMHRRHSGSETSPRARQRLLGPLTNQTSDGAVSSGSTDTYHCSATRHALHPDARAGQQSKGGAATCRKGGGNARPRPKRASALDLTFTSAGGDAGRRRGKAMGGRRHIWALRTVRPSIGRGIPLVEIRTPRGYAGI